MATARPVEDGYRGAIGFVCGSFCSMGKES